MKFPVELQEAELIRRYKRFLADILLDDGTELTIHCPNSGSMRSCSEPGSRVCFSRSDNPKRKYPHTLEMVKVGEGWVGVNTSLTNQLVTEALSNGTIVELAGFDSLKREVKTSDGSRLDILLIKDGKKTYVEVKNCSLVENRSALFPDAVTARGTKHLNELSHLLRQGHQGVIFFLVQRSDADTFTPAAAIDPLYAETLARVREEGVMVLAYQAEVTPEAIEVTGSMPVVL
jgi:sugar fermentation stimulation protein A